VVEAVTVWVTVEDVAALLGITDTADVRLVDVTAASDDYCKRQRPDIAAGVEPGEAVRLAAGLYAAHLFRRRTAPSGFPAYDELGQFEGSESMTEVYRLLGNRKPVAL
jgi:hypothetical protein